MEQVKKESSELKMELTDVSNELKFEVIAYTFSMMMNSKKNALVEMKTKSNKITKEIKDFINKEIRDGQKIYFETHRI